MLQCENRACGVRKSTLDSISTRVQFNSFIERYTDAYRMEMLHFLDVIEGTCRDDRVV